MRRRLPRSVALPAAAALLLFSAAPANADPTYPTTPIPQPANPGQAPISAPVGPQPLGQAVGDAGTALGIIRLLPNAVPTSTILPGFGATLPKQSALEAGMGLSSASANSDAYLSYEKAIAQASPFGLSVGGNAPQTPGSVVQTALPDNPQPISGGLNAPSNPLLNVGLLNGSAHARWSPTLGPCVDTIADASTSVASLSLLNVIPSMPNLGLDALKPKLDPNALASGFDLSKGLQSLGGLLQGGGQTAADGTGSLLSLPNTLSSRSQVKLVDIPGSQNKAVQSTSTLQAADIEVLKGTPLALSIKVASQPTLTVTSTGDAKTSKVEYTAPVLTIEAAGKTLYTLDAAHPTKDIPIGLPLKGLSDQFGQVNDIPVVGGLVSTLTNGIQQVGNTAGTVLDLGVLRLSIAGLDQKSAQMTTPFKGFQLGASARLFDLQLLPTTKLKSLLPDDQAKNLPSSLAQLSLGEQVARAYAPTDGVVCGTTSTPPAGGGEAPKGPVKNLAYTGGAYDTVPLFWTGTAMLLLGVVMVAAMPGTRRRPLAVAIEEKPFKPSPRPRE
ncbi:hypothetical protein [Amycolatopsis australiensis]|uniref:Choice-of-anchor G family protein n=1 Tax=Amycolatopsis australiensis TaxID=546364 RepID=A0A1K1QHL7_9PSEU|nr:hypothetical protein [Amycolatopsis australiensis]SFW59204.1 hypothetical protein SAMN04489730_1798 [Amycolatopsis australiensis]